MSRAALALTVLLATGCFHAEPPEEIAGGGGVETTEGNLASLSVAPVGARVSLIPADFDPLRGTLPDSLTVLADAKGAYRFRGLTPGRYNLEAYLPSAGTRCFRAGVTITHGDRHIAGTDTLTPPGRLRLRWDGLRLGVLTQKGRSFRMNLADMKTDSGGVILDSLPAGLLPPFSFTDEVNAATRVWTDSVRIVPGVLDSVPILGEWGHTALLTFDTTSLSSDSLEGYPLLVRLSSPEFPFSEAAHSGEDLRFTTEDGTVLSHTVERWDSAAGHAEIWVRLKTPPGGGFGSLRMDWGNPMAPIRSDTLFDSVSGFTGVWHLNEKNAGVIGSSQRFDGNGVFVAAKGESQPPSQTQLCVSAWIFPDTAGMVGGLLGGEAVKRWAILSNWRESDTSGFVLEYLPIYNEVVLELGLDSTSDLAVAGPFDTALYNAWHLIAATYDGAEVQFWLDGRLMNTSQEGPGAFHLPAQEYWIGASTGNSNAEKTDFFRGNLDEARVLHSIPPRAWLELDYLAQRPGSNFIRFRKLR